MLRLHSFAVDQTSTYKHWISAMQSKHTHMYFPWSQENAPRAPTTKEVSWRSQLARFADMCAYWTPTQNAFWQEVRSERDDLTSCRVSATLGGRSCPWAQILDDSYLLRNTYLLTFIVQVPHLLKDLVKSVFTIKNQHGWGRGDRKFSIPNLIYWKSNNP